MRFAIVLSPKCSSRGVNRRVSILKYVVLGIVLFLATFGLQEEHLLSYYIGVSACPESLLFDL
jgi:hypothetical protein